MKTVIDKIVVKALYEREVIRINRKYSLQLATSQDTGKIRAVKQIVKGREF